MADINYLGQIPDICAKQPVQTLQIGQLKFRYQFRKHQSLMLEKFEQERNADINSRKGRHFRFHLVSPPGSGKTIVGLEMAIRLQKPVLVVCPNTAIQGQWADKLEMFYDGPAASLKELISTDTGDLKQINIFTYQMLSVPINNSNYCGNNGSNSNSNSNNNSNNNSKSNGNSNGSDYDSFTRISENLWADYVAESQGITPEEALFRISSMKTGNPASYRAEISKFNRKLRMSYLEDPECSISKILHPNTIKLIKDLKRLGIGTVIFDECHHLLNYWALTMREIVYEIGASSTIGLTATPPLDETKERLECYSALLGSVHYSIPTPAVVKDGMLAPYQDLVFFCTPDGKELEYVRECHSRFKKIVSMFDLKDCDFYYWVYDRIVKRELLSGESQDWTSFINTRPALAVSGVRYLLKHAAELPWDITITENMYEEMVLEDWSTLIEDYALNLLKLSGLSEDRELYDEIRDALKRLGYVLTEKGMRRQHSPLDRVLAYSRSKLAGVREILKAEMKAMGDGIRVAVITDFEISNALSLRKMAGVMDDECGGAVSVIRELASDPETAKLAPVMITSGNVICGSGLADSFLSLASSWGSENGLDISLAVAPDCIPAKENNACTTITCSGSDWNSRSAILFTTSLFEEGITKCIIGTRGLLSEGWDSVNLNTLIDLTAVTTFASVNQLRGRCMRLSDTDPRKTSNIWDVTCIAPGLEKGYNDLSRLYRKHGQYYGVCDDGQIQRGINHVDPSIGMSENDKIGMEDIARINRNMLEIYMDRNRTYDLWKVGESFENIEIESCELKIGKPVKTKAPSLLLNERAILKGKVRDSISRLTGSVLTLAGGLAVSVSALPASFAVLGLSAFLGYRTYAGFREAIEYGRDNFFNLAVKTSVMDFGKCLLKALAECGIVETSVREEKIIITERSDGTYRIYLDGYEKASEIFAGSLAQIFAPISDQRYAIQRFEAMEPGEGPDAFFYFIGGGVDRKDPVLSCYHPVPEVFNIREKVLVYKKYWNMYVSPGDIVFLKGEKGRGIIEKYGRINFLGVKKKVTSVWK